MEKLVIIGSGIAGLTAAIYASRAELSPLVISGSEEGGQLMWTTDVENFPGFPKGILGPQLIENCKKQAERFGAKFKFGQVQKIEKKKNSFKLILDEGSVEAQAIIIATGASAKWLGISSEQKYKGRGVSACAVCDGPFFKNKELLVIGGGDAAMEEALSLLKFTSKITIVHRGSEFRASKIMQERVLSNKNIKVIWNTEVLEFLGDGKKLNAVKLKNNQTGKVSDFKCEGACRKQGEARLQERLSSGRQEHAHVY